MVIDDDERKNEQSVESAVTAKEKPGLENSKVGESQNVTQKCGASLFIGIKNLGTLRDMPFSNAF